MIINFLYRPIPPVASAKRSITQSLGWEINTRRVYPLRWIEPFFTANFVFLGGRYKKTRFWGTESVRASIPAATRNGLFLIKNGPFWLITALYRPIPPRLSGGIESMLSGGAI